MTRVTDQPAIVVHTRPYRESSLLLSVLTLDHGLLTLVGRGVRG
ncbi:MAG: DNA repair protein RecO, partial [Gammaproteobacteria bacterium]